jgi:hypothetical protein
MEYAELRTHTIRAPLSQCVSAQVRLRFYLDLHRLV